MAPSAPATRPTDPELGLVQWGRDLEGALARSRDTGRPVLVLFDEVPGCATCVGFGRQVLAHPLLAEAIETEFEPVFVANNRPGRDAAVLARFGEPAWNNPVVRFLDAGGNDLLAREDGLYSAHEIAQRMVEALERARRPVPPYLSLALDETHLAGRRVATFGMFCFWEGEARLGAIDGVLETHAVQMPEGEAVRVTYDHTRLPFARLVAEAERRGCADRVYARDTEELETARRIVGSRARRSDERASEPGPGDHRHALGRSSLRFLPLTPMQAMRVNSALAEGTDPRRLLSPRQWALAASLATASAAERAHLAEIAPPADLDAWPAYAARVDEILSR